MTFGTLVGVLDMNPTVEIWNASKIASIKNLAGTTTIVHDEQVEKWLASVGKRNFLNQLASGNNTKYDTSTTWPALRVQSGRNLRLQKSTNLFTTGETFFMVFRITTNSVWMGYWKLRTISNYNSNYWNSAEGNGELASFSDKFVCTFDSTLNLGPTTGDIGTLPFLICLACRIQQIGTDVVIWSMGSSGEVVINTVAGTWRNNTTANLELQTNSGVMHVYYCEINQEIKTTAQMKARRDELYNRFV